MAIPRPKEVYVDHLGNRFIVTGIETKDDGFYTHYVNKDYKTFSCRSEAFLDRYRVIDNDSSSRNNQMGK